MEASVTVVIPVYNAASTLERCLQALAAQTLMPKQIIVADNGSGDDSAAIVRGWMEHTPALPLHLIAVDRRGAAAARNAAVQQADSDWIAFTDSDCLPEPNWIANGMALVAADDERIVALAGPARGSLEGDAAARLLGLTTLSASQSEEICSDAGPTGMRGFAAANLWVRRRSILEIGGFDETLTVAGEDMDLCARLYAAGGRLHFSPALSVRHIHATGVASMWRKAVQYGQAHASLFRRHGRAGIYIELPLLGQLRMPCRCYLWCNLSSAEKKLLLLLILGLYAHAWLWLVPAYIIWLGLLLRRRALALDVSCPWSEAVWLGVLLVVKSAAMTWGRIRGSHRGVLTC